MRARTWLEQERFALALVGLFTATVATMFAVWSLAPVAVGWWPYVVTSGSMAPAFDRGDVLVVEPHDGRGLGPGTIVVFERDGAAVAHRIEAVQGDGTYRTRGDANRLADSTPLRPADVRGVARIKVPLAGRIVLAWRADPATRTLPLLAGLALVLHGARVALSDDADPWARRREATR
jgi:signal peptidase I